MGCIAEKSAQSTDATLAAQGDMEAFERLYRSQLAAIHRLASWMLGRAEVDDAIQEIFVRAWTRLDLFRGKSAFGTWLRRLAVNVLVRYRGRVRGRQSRQVCLEEAAGQGALSASVSLRMDLEAALATLPKGARQVFVLHDVEGYKHDEIASALSISPSTSRAQLHRARSLLRRFLN